MQTCKGYHYEMPMPKVHRHCLFSCSRSFKEGCEVGDEYIEKIVQEDWTRLKKEANPHLDADEL